MLIIHDTTSTMLEGGAILLETKMELGNRKTSCRHRSAASTPEQMEHLLEVHRKDLARTASDFILYGVTLSYDDPRRSVIMTKSAFERLGPVHVENVSVG